MCFKQSVIINKMNKKSNKKVQVLESTPDSAGFSFLRFFNSKAGVFLTIIGLFGAGFGAKGFLSDQAFEDKISKNNLENSIQIFKLEAEKVNLQREKQHLVEENSILRDSLNSKNLKDEKGQAK